MSQFRICKWLLAVCISLHVATLEAQSVGPMEKLLPQTTRGCVVVSDVQDFADHWRKTLVGQLMADPVMKPFVEDVEQAFEDRWSKIRDRVGLTWDDLKDVPSGEVAMAVVAAAPDRSAVVALIDVTGRLDEAKQLMDKVAASLEDEGATQSAVQVGQTTVIQFDLPKSKQGTTAKKNPRVFYFLQGNLLAASDELDVLKAVLIQSSAQPGPSLADMPAYQVVIKRCAADLRPGAKPQVRWFVDPLAYFDAIRSAIPQEHRRKGRPLVQILRETGFGALKAAGGFIDLATEEGELVRRTFVYAPKPWPTGDSINILAFQEGTDFVPQPWVPRDVASYGTFYFDFLKAFDSIDKLFDVIYNEPGIWRNDILASLEEEYEVDFRKDLIQHLGPRVTIISNYRIPITPASEQLAFAIETKNAKAVAAAIKKTIGEDIKVHKIGGHTIWETVKEKRTNGSGRRKGGPPPLDSFDEEEEEELGRLELLPNPSVTVANGHLLIASDLEFLKRILKPKERHESLAGTFDFRLVQAKAGSASPLRAKCGFVFMRSDKKLQPAYELARERRLLDSETILSSLLDRFLTKEQQKKIRQRKSNTENWPDFDVLRRYLGLGALTVTAEPQGWFLKGVQIKRATPSSTPAPRPLPPPR